MRRRYEHYPFLFVRQTNQGRGEQAQFTDTSLVSEYFGQRSLRPATAWQLRIQFDEACGNTFDDNFGILIAAPDSRVLEDEVEGHEV